MQIFQVLKKKFIEYVIIFKLNEITDAIIKCLKGLYDNDQKLNPYKDFNTQVFAKDKRGLIY